MNVDQTNQLIQLILNSLLLGLCCGGMVIMTSVRWRMAGDRLQGRADQWGYDHGLAGSSYWTKLYRQRRRLRRQYRIERLSHVTAHYSLTWAILSALVVSMRSLLNWNGLIWISLVCFVISTGLLLASVLGVLAAIHGVGESALCGDRPPALLAEKTLPVSGLHREKSRAMKRPRRSQKLSDKGVSVSL
jgi:hypothetical protein